MSVSLWLIIIVDVLIILVQQRVKAPFRLCQIDFSDSTTNLNAIWLLFAYGAEEEGQKPQHIQTFILFIEDNLLWREQTTRLI